MSEISNMPELSSPAQRKSIPGLESWLQSPQGKQLLRWEQAVVDAAVNDIFGFNAVQLGFGSIEFLRTSRIPLRQRIDLTGKPDLLAELTALPLATQSTDLVVLPHGLEFHPEPHQILREIERVLIPEGQLLILGFNPLSLWGVQRRLQRSAEFPWQGDYLSAVRLRDWLKLLGFEVNRGIYGAYAPPVQQESWIKRWHFMENAGSRWWPFAGGVYFLHAIKRVHSMRLITPKWNAQLVRAKALRPIAQKEGHGR